VLAIEGIGQPSKKLRNDDRLRLRTTGASRAAGFGANPWALYAALVGILIFPSYLQRAYSIFAVSVLAPALVWYAGNHSGALALASLVDRYGSNNSQAGCLRLPPVVQRQARRTGLIQIRSRLALTSAQRAKPRGHPPL
jgi:hypothetical protein